MMANETYQPDDGIQHGIDDNPENDPQKGAAIGGVGGAAVGAAAGAMTGPIGAVIGAVVGGALGAVASGAAVAAVDARDNDDNMTGMGDKIDYDKHDVDDDDDVTTNAYDRDLVGVAPARDTDVAGLGATTGAPLSPGAYGGTTPEGFILDNRTPAERAMDETTGENIGRETDHRFP